MKVGKVEEVPKEEKNHSRNPNKIFTVYIHIHTFVHVNTCT
jgi:hypothetical protein